MGENEFGVLHLKYNRLLKLGFHNFKVTLDATVPFLWKFDDDHGLTGCLALGLAIPCFVGSRADDRQLVSEGQVGRFET